MGLVDFIGIDSNFPVTSNPLPSLFVIKDGVLQPTMRDVCISLIGKSEGQPTNTPGYHILWQYSVLHNLAEYIVNVVKRPGYYGLLVELVDEL